IGVAPKAISKLKKRVRECWNMRNSVPFKKLRAQWRQYIRGWWNYFRLADRRWEVRNLSGWIRRHMRKYFWQRWHHPRGRLKGLKRMGVYGRALGMAYSGLGKWKIAGSRTLQWALG